MVKEEANFLICFIQIPKTFQFILDFSICVWCLPFWSLTILLRVFTFLNQNGICCIKAENAERQSGCKERRNCLKNKAASRHEMKNWVCKWNEMKWNETLLSFGVIENFNEHVSFRDIKQLFAKLHTKPSRLYFSLFLAS